MNSANQLKRVSGFIERMPAHASVMTGGTAIRARVLLRTVVVAGLRQDDEMVQSEIFGPVITVQKFDDEAGPLSGPTGWVPGWHRLFGRDHLWRLPAIEILDFGYVWINTHIPLIGQKY